jgi:hypothetical protein
MASERFIVEQSAVETRVVPKIKSVRPFGSTILVEMLNADEALGTRMYIKQDASVSGAPQAYILAFGPKLNSEEAGLKVGDRVMLQGTFVPVPKYDNSTRNRGIVEIHNVKAVFEEAELVTD